MIITKREYNQLIKDLEYYKRRFFENEMENIGLKNRQNYLENIILLKEKEIKKLKSKRRK